MCNTAIDQKKPLEGVCSLRFYPLNKTNFTYEEKVDISTGEILDYKPSISEINYLAKGEIRKISAFKRVCECSTRAVPNRTIQLKRTSDNTLYYSNLNKCASAWSCPTCGAKIRANKAKQVQDLMEAHVQRGGICVVGIFTIQHTKEENLKDVLKDLDKVYRKFNDGKGGKQFKENHNIIGSIYANEVVYGENGWHPHKHMIYFLNKIDNVSFISERWISQAEKVGREAVSFANGFEVVQDVEAVSNYISKSGVGKIAIETTAFSIKNDSVGMNPFQLALFGEKDLFNEYEEGYKGKRAISFSRGLFEKMEVKKDKRSDEEIVKAEESESEIICSISNESFKAIRFFNAEFNILQLASSSNESIEQYIEDLTEKYRQRKRKIFQKE